MGSEGSMAIELDLPNGLSLEIHATPVRYEKLEEGYLIGARISRMKPRDRDCLTSIWKRSGKTRKRSTDFADYTDSKDIATKRHKKHKSI